MRTFNFPPDNGFVLSTDDINHLYQGLIDSITALGGSLAQGETLVNLGGVTASASTPDPITDPTIYMVSSGWLYYNDSATGNTEIFFVEGNSPSGGLSIPDGDEAPNFYIKEVNGVGSVRPLYVPATGAQATDPLNVNTGLLGELTKIRTIVLDTVVNATVNPDTLTLFKTWDEFIQIKDAFSVLDEKIAVEVGTLATAITSLSETITQVSGLAQRNFDDTFRKNGNELILLDGISNFNDITNVGIFFGQGMQNNIPDGDNPSDWYIHHYQLGTNLVQLALKAETARTYIRVAQPNSNNEIEWGIWNDLSSSRAVTDTLPPNGIINFNRDKIIAADVTSDITLGVDTGAILGSLVTLKLTNTSAGPVKIDFSNAFKVINDGLSLVQDMNPNDKALLYCHYTGALPQDTFVRIYSLNQDPSVTLPDVPLWAVPTPLELIDTTTNGHTIRLTWQVDATPGIAYIIERQVFFKINDDWVVVNNTNLVPFVGNTFDDVEAVPRNIISPIVRYRLTAVVNGVASLNTSTVEEITLPATPMLPTPTINESASGIVDLNEPQQLLLPPEAEDGDILISFDYDNASAPTTGLVERFEVERQNLTLGSNLQTFFINDPAQRYFLDTDQFLLTNQTYQYRIRALTSATEVDAFNSGFSTPIEINT
ncbi:MAG: hypothetical protein ACPGJS_05500 [Flammeovirgaceae bacterium]